MLAGQIVGLCLLSLARSEHGFLGNLASLRQRHGNTVVQVACNPLGCVKPDCRKCDLRIKQCYNKGCRQSYEDTKAQKDLWNVYKFCECLGEKLRCGGKDNDHHNHIHGHKRRHRKHDNEREEEIRRMKIKAVKLLYGIRSVIRPEFFDRYNKACESRRFGKCFRILKECLGMCPSSEKLGYYTDRRYWNKKLKKMGGFFKSFCFYDKNLECFANKNVWEFKTRNYANQNSYEFFLPKSCISPFTHVFATTPTEDLGYMNGLVGTDSSWVALLDEYEKKLIELVKCGYRNGKISTEAVILHLRLKLVSFLTITCRTAYSGLQVNVKQNEIVRILNYMLDGTFDWFLSAFAGSLKAQCQK